MLVRPNDILVKDPKTVTFEDKNQMSLVLKFGMLGVQRLKILITILGIYILKHC